MKIWKTLKNLEENQNKHLEEIITKSMFQKKDLIKKTDLQISLKTTSKKLLKKVESGKFTPFELLHAIELQTSLTRIKLGDFEKEKVLQILFTELEFYWYLLKKKELDVSEFYTEKSELKLQKSQFKKIGLQLFYILAKNNPFDFTLEISLKFMQKYPLILISGLNSLFISKESINNLLIFSFFNSIYLQLDFNYCLLPKLRANLVAKDQNFFEDFLKIVSILEAAHDKQFHGAFYSAFERFYQNEIFPHNFKTNRCPFYAFLLNLYTQITSLGQITHTPEPQKILTLSNTPSEFLESLRKMVG